MRFESRRRRRRREALDQPFPDEWRMLLVRRWPLWSLLSDDERFRMEFLIQEFVYDIRWEAANNFDIADIMKVLIAAQACLLVLELGDDDDEPSDYYRGVSTVIVHPSTVVLSGPRATGSGGLQTNAPTRIDGQAHFGGPVIVAWDSVSIDARHPGRGLNVVFHEFAHKLDMLDGVIDGTPPLVMGEARERWIEVCTREYKAIRRGSDGDGELLRAYGGTDPGEFFAVATEMFFSRPVDMKTRKPDLYDVLSGFYRQDPAARFPAPVIAPVTPVTVETT
ncbi:MAG: M90 family metallopeptidase [Ilumatobacteraceae bacterium]